MIWGSILTRWGEAARCTPWQALLCFALGQRVAAQMGDVLMSRVIAIAACGFTLAACSMSMPSLDMFKSGPSTETLRIESEPGGADARTAQGQSCRTPCELTLPAGNETQITVALNGYQPQTVPVRPEVGGTSTLQPNPVYVELQPMASPVPAKKRPAKKKATTAARVQTQPAATTAGTEGAGSPPANAANSYPWPPPPPQ